MIDIADHPDLKFVEFGNQNFPAVAANSAQTFELIIPQNRLCMLVQLIAVSNKAWRFQVDTWFIDDVNMRNQVVSNFIADDKGFLLSNISDPILVNPATTRGILNMLPMRKSSKVDLFNLDAALTASMTVRWMGLVHEDPDKEYEAAATAGKST